MKVLVKKTLKSKWFVGLSAFLLLIVLLSIDDEINPRITELMTKYSELGNLKYNAWIYLMGIGAKSDADVQQAGLNWYNNWQLDSNYPEIQIGVYKVDSNACIYSEIGCIENYLNNPSQIDEVLQANKELVERYKALHQMTNFSNVCLPKHCPMPNFDGVQAMHRLALLEVIQQIVVGKKEQAINLYFKQLDFVIELSANTPWLLHKIITYVQIQDYIMTMYELSRRGFFDSSHREQIAHRLKLLPKAAISFREQLQREALWAIHAVESEQRLKKYASIIGILYKPNRSYNQHFATYNKMIQLSEVDDRQFYSVASAFELPKFEMDYLNIIGSSLFATAVPRFATITGSYRSINLKLHLLRFYLENYDAFKRGVKVETLAEQQQFTNLYDESLPFMEDEQHLCFHWYDEESICLKLQPGLWSD